MKSGLYKSITRVNQACTRVARVKYNTSPSCFFCDILVVNVLDKLTDNLLAKFLYNSVQK